MRPEKLFPEVTEEEKKKGARGWEGIGLAIMKKWMKVEGILP